MLFRILFCPLILFVRWLLSPVRFIMRTYAASQQALLEIKIRGLIYEGPPRPERFRLLKWVRDYQAARTGLAPEGVYLEKIHRLVDEIIADPRAAGLLVTLENLSGGWASLEALRDELARITHAKKRVIVWLPEGGGNAEFFVASVASMILAPPVSDVQLIGVKSEASFFRKALEHLGIQFELHARKEYKSAGERFVRDSRSDADRFQTEAIVAALHQRLIEVLSQGRNVSEDIARAWIDQGPTRASEAQSRGLIDLVAYDDDLPALLKSKIEPADPYLMKRMFLKPQPIFSRKKHIAIVQVHGTITSAASPLAWASGSVALAEQVIADLRAAERDPQVAGVILDVDSRGGTVTASDAIYAAAKRVASKKPIVARMGNVAASGGYYVACAGQAIVARPLTITGSIGVISTRPIATQLVQRLGIHHDTIARGQFADIGNVLREPTHEENELFEREVDAHYNSFVSLVSRSRGRNESDIEPLARGRVYTGFDAKTCGLVDHMGGLEEAIALLKKSLPNVHLEERPYVIAASLPSQRLSLEPAMAAWISALRHSLPTQLVRSIFDWLPLVATLADTRTRVLAMNPFLP